MKKSGTVIHNLRELRIFARDFSKKIFSRSSSRAIIAGLTGQLGAGKTTFTRALLRSFGVREKIISPTFLLIRSYQINLPVGGKNYHRAFHIDAYRLNSEKEILALGFKKIISDPGHIVLIEWADKIKKIMPQDTVWLNFKFGRGERERILSS